MKQLFPCRQKRDGQLPRATCGCKIVFPVGETIIMLKTTYGDVALNRTGVDESFLHFKNAEMSIKESPRTLKSDVLEDHPLINEYHGVHIYPKIWYDKSCRQIYLSVSKGR